MKPRPVTLREWGALGAILLLAAGLRFYHLTEQGIRTSDGGHYAWQAVKVLQDQPEGIKDKPGHTLLIVLSFFLFGVRMSSPMILSALLGLCTVLLVWGVVRRWQGPAAGLLTAFVASFLSYTLLYHRCAQSDGNLLTALFAGVLLLGRGLGRMGEPQASGRQVLCDFVWPGVLFGFALSINYSVATTFVPAVLTLALLWVLVPGKRSFTLSAAAGLVAGFIVGYALVLGFMWRWLEHKEYFRQVLYHKSGFLKSEWNLRSLAMLRDYVGVPALLLAVAGTVRLLQRRKPLDWFCLVLVGFMAIAYSRTILPYPRVYFPLTLPVLLCCGAGFEYLLERLRCRPALQFAASASIVAAIFLFQWPQARDAVLLQSGYEEACEILRSEEVKVGGTTHTWWAFEAFVGRPFGFCSDALAEKFAAEDWDTRVPRLLRHWESQGFSHLVIDYYFWNRMNTKYNDRLERFLRQFPPAFRIPNPVARHKQTVDEDGGLPEAGSNPLSEFIYIFRLQDFREPAPQD